MARYDVVVIGGGSNGLVAAATLAKAGRSVLVLEEREATGGRAATVEFHPGYKVSPTLHSYGGLLPKVVAELDLERHGLELLPDDPGVTTLQRGGPSFHLPAGRADAQAAATRLSEADGKGYGRLAALLDRIVTFAQPLLSLQPLPLGKQRWLSLLEPAWQAFRFRRLGEQDMLELLRIAPMCLKDLLDDHFESEVLKATLALPALLGSSAGPWSPGTTTNLLMWEVSSNGGRLRRGGLPRGGMGAVAQALDKAARAAGVEVRAGARVATIKQGEGGRATGVVLAGESGEEIEAKAVISGASPRKTFFDLLDIRPLGPTFRRRLENYRSRGAVAKVHFALDALPQVDGEPAAGRVQIGASLAALEKAHDDAKYGRVSTDPFMDVVFPTVADPSLAPEGKHVASVWVQQAPYDLREGDWDSERSTLGERVQTILEEHMPGFGDAVVHREVLAPPDLEARFGLEGGHPFGGELSLDQLFTNRPIPECGTYGTPVPGLYLTGSATHPGVFLTGAAGNNAARRVLRDWKEIAARAKA